MLANLENWIKQKMYSLEFKGVTELQRTIATAQKLDDVKKLIRQHTANMARITSRLAPVKTGFMKRSLVTSIVDGGLTGIAEFYAEYTPYQEWGTRWMPGKFFLKRGFETASNEFISDMQRLVK